MSRYAELGVRPVINADARLTRLGGSLMAPEVRAAMDAAARQYVDMHELQAVIGRRLAALTHKPTTAPVPSNWKRYVEKLPNDPWGRPYGYAQPGVKGEVDVFSYGADGKPGGESADADIGSWQ